MALTTLADEWSSGPNMHGAAVLERRTTERVSVFRLDEPYAPAWGETPGRWVVVVGGAHAHQFHHRTPQVTTTTTIPSFI
jgi:hypothetical protein